MAAPKEDTLLPLPLQQVAGLIIRASLARLFDAAGARHAGVARLDLLDVLALGVGRAADERAEAAAPLLEGGLRSRGTSRRAARGPAPVWPGIGLVKPHPGKSEHPKNLPRRPSLITRGLAALGADLVGGLGGDLLLRHLARLVQAVLHRLVEGLDDRDVGDLALRHLVQPLLHVRGELVVHEVVAEVADQEVAGHRPGVGGVETFVLDPDEVAFVVEDRRHDRRVGRRPADAAGLQLLDQRRLRVTREAAG